MALTYPFSAPVNGVDVSKYQGNIDWSKVKPAGYTFAFVRLGYANGDGSIVMDPYFQKNVTNALAAGLDVGTYLYSYIDSVDHARIAANHVLEIIDDYDFSMPIVLDYEHGSKYKDFSRDKNSQICNAFLGIIASAGYLPMYYSYTSFVNSYMNMATLEQYEGLWIANYTGKIGVDNTAIWQHSSSGSVPGIPGRCDLNRMYCDIPRIIKEKYNKQEVTFTPLTNKQLEVFVDGKCEYFSQPTVYATIPNPAGGTMRLPAGTYTATQISNGIIEGFTFVAIQYQDQTVYVAVLDDRCRIIDAPESFLTLRIEPMPNEGDRKNIEAYCKSLGFDIEWQW